MNIFIAFANEDRDVRDKLLKQMNLVKGRQGWKIWSAYEIKAGEQWDTEIQQRLTDAEVVVLLLSTDFFNSEYIIEKELPEVISKHQKGDCQIIPVIARVCHWKDTAFGDYAQLGDIQALPAGEKPMMSKKYWDEEDQPYFEVVQGIIDSIRAFQLRKKERAERIEQERLLLEKQKQEAAMQARLSDEKQKAEAERIRQAERETQEKIRQEQVKQKERALEQKAREEQESDAKRRRETQAKKDIEEQERLSSIKREQENAYQLADNAMWQQIILANEIDAYQSYLIQFPSGAHVQTARYRIKEIKKQNAPPVLCRYAIAGGLAILLFLLVLLLGRGMFFNREAPSGENPQLSSNTTTSVPDTVKRELPSTSTPKESAIQAKEKEPEIKPVPKKEKKPVNTFPPIPTPASHTSEKIYELFDLQKVPSFPGGDISMKKFINENLQYPPLAERNNIQGIVAVNFVVRNNGEIGNIEVVKEIGGGCGIETVRLVRSMPKWIPGEMNGKPVNSRFTLPVYFRLD